MLESAVLTPLLFLCLALQQAPGGAMPVDAAQPDIARAALQAAEPAVPAGVLVKARVRGPALASIMQYRERWRLTSAGGAEVAAWLELPPGGNPPKRHPLTFIQRQAAAGQDALLLIDRGEQALPLNRLAPVMAETHYLGRVIVEASADGKNYVGCGPEQLVCQEIRAGQFLSVNQIACDPGDKRYLRLLFSGGGGKLSLQNIEGWFESEPAGASAKQDAALGAMRNGASPGQHIWPLILQDSSALLTKLAVQATASAALRQVSIVRLDQQLAPLRTEASFIWAGSLKLGVLTRDATQTKLPVSSSAELWGIVVEDEKLPPLQLKSVQVWTADAWLYFIMPAQPELELRFAVPAALALSADGLDFASAAPCGEFSALSPLEQQSTKQDSILQQVPADWLGFTAKWWRMAIYVLAALVALGISLNLRRSSASSDTR